MERTRLGTQGLEVSRLGLGCMGMSEFYGVASEAESIKTIHHAIDSGIDFFDTADIYGLGKNEELLGHALRAHRGKVKVASKFGNVRDESGAFIGLDGRPEYVRQCCENSVRRLGIDTIDLYYQHRVDPKVPIEETVGEMSRLVSEGKVRYIGLSEASAATLKRAHATHKVTAIQSEYSIWTRDPELGGVLDACKDLGIGFVAYAPLGRGFLTGVFESKNQLPAGDYRITSPRFAQGNFDHNKRLVDGLKRIALKKNCSLAQLALAWVIAQSDCIVPIAGTTRIPHLAENIKALEIRLSESDLSEINRIFPAGSALGERYLSSGMKALGR